MKDNITRYFDRIDFDNLPDSFVMKCSHGCKWQYIVKDKVRFLQNKHLIDIVKRQMTGWLEQEFWLFEGIELQYKGLSPKIIIEPLMRDEININSKEIQLYFLNNSLKYIIKIHNSRQVTVWDGNLNYTDDKFAQSDIKIFEKADENIKLIKELSKILAADFKFVRVDWMLYKNNPYFEELTFTPYSGFSKIKSQNILFELSLIDL